jgi:NAD(P)-dependent dehydrogenase (short-subunit alcohol dehydrogenase family)
MRIAVFGATGSTGRSLVAQALNGGHSVVVCARHPEKLGIAHERLTVVEGDLSDVAAIERAVERVGRRGHGHVSFACESGGLHAQAARGRSVRWEGSNRDRCLASQDATSDNGACAEHVARKIYTRWKPVLVFGRNPRGWIRHGEYRWEWPVPLQRRTCLRSQMGLAFH